MTQEEAAVLLAENAWLRTEVGVLQQANAKLRQQLQLALAQFKKLEGGKTDPPSFVKPNRPAASEPRRPRKKRAAEHNKGRKRSEWCIELVEMPTRIERHALERCPDCNYRLQGESIDYRREVIEIPAPQPVEVIEHQVIKRLCPHCGKWCRPKLDLKGQNGYAWAFVTAGPGAVRLFEYDRSRGHAELFQFVLPPGVPADNNLAERSIRPLEIMRKISGGSRSDNGTKTRLALASLFHTQWLPLRRAQTSLASDLQTAQEEIHP